MRKDGLSCGGQGRFHREDDERDLKGQARFCVAVGERHVYGESVFRIILQSWVGRVRGLDTLVEDTIRRREGRKGEREERRERGREGQKKKGDGGEERGKTS